jgi:hypothetical protein
MEQHFKNRFYVHLVIVFSIRYYTNFKFVAERRVFFKY